MTSIAADLVRRHSLTATDLVVEVGSGDGAFLQHIHDLGPRVLGIETDASLAARAFAAGVDTLAAEFTPATTADACRRYGPCRVLVARGVMVGGSEWQAFLAAARRCLAPGGVIVVHSAGTNALVEVRPDLVVPHLRAA